MQILHHLRAMLSSNLAPGASLSHISALAQLLSGNKRTYSDRSIYTGKQLRAIRSAHGVGRGEEPWRSARKARCNQIKTLGA